MSCGRQGGNPTTNLAVVASAEQQMQGDQSETVFEICDVTVHLS